MTMPDKSKKLIAAGFALLLVFTQGCSSSDDDDGSMEPAADPAAALYGKWDTALDLLGHVGFSHLTINADGSFESDLEFVVSGSDCLLDRTTTGGYVATGTTITLSHESGTQAVRDCTGDNAVANHDERAMTAAEIAENNVVGELMWAIEGDILTMTDGAGITRMYTPLTE